jgi:PhoPQ-activated pathogenicity-related protein
MQPPTEIICKVARFESRGSSDIAALIASRGRPKTETWEMEDLDKPIEIVYYIAYIGNITRVDGLVQMTYGKRQNKYVKAPIPTTRQQRQEISKIARETIDKELIKRGYKNFSLIIYSDEDKNALS